MTDRRSSSTPQRSIRPCGSSERPQRSSARKRSGRGTPSSSRSENDFRSELTDVEDGSRPVRRDALIRLLTALGEYFDLPYDVKLVISKKLTTHFGENEVKDRHAVITIAAGIPHALAAETLIHEYAHLMAHDYRGRNRDAAWALAYNEVYNFCFDGH